MRLSSEKQDQGVPVVTGGHHLLTVGWREVMGACLVLRGKGAQTSSEVACASQGSVTTERVRVGAMGE